MREYLSDYLLKYVNINIQSCHHIFDGKSILFVSRYRKRGIIYCTLIFFSLRFFCLKFLQSTTVGKSNSRCKNVHTCEHGLHVGGLYRRKIYFPLTASSYPVDLASRFSYSISDRRMARSHSASALARGENNRLSIISLLLERKKKDEGNSRDVG